MGLQHQLPEHRKWTNPLHQNYFFKSASMEKVVNWNQPMALSTINHLRVCHDSMQWTLNVYRYWSLHQNSYGGSLHQKLLYCWWCVKNTFDEVFQWSGNCPFSDVMKPGKHCESQAKQIFRIFKLEKPQKCTTSPAIWRLHIKKEWK